MPNAEPPRRVLHEYAELLYSHPPDDDRPSDPVEPLESPVRERVRASRGRVPVSTSLESPAVVGANGSSSGSLPRSRRGEPPDGGQRRIRVGIVGATGYVGSELIRLLSRHPNVDIVALAGRDRHDDPI